MTAMHNTNDSNRISLRPRDMFEHKDEVYRLNYPKVAFDPATGIPNTIYLTDESDVVHGSFIFRNGTYTYRDLYSQESFPEETIRSMVRTLNSKIRDDETKENIINTLIAS